jgi:basic membrane protein A
LLSAFVGLGLTSTAFAESDPAVIYGLGGKFDRSFNESSYMGAERFKSETGVSYREFELQSDAQREQALRRFAQQGRSPIIVAGFAFEQPVITIASEFPETEFVIIDAVVDLPNVKSLVFKEHEGSFLVGLLAAMASKNGSIGFVGGMDIPLIRAFACGYRQGAELANENIVILENMTGTTGAAWSDPVKGGELARAQIGRGADVVFQAAGGTGIGVLQAAADGGALGIGTDSNQNDLHPGQVLTSMLKRVDVAVYSVLMAAHQGTFEAGISSIGLAEGGVDWADDENNKSLITDEMRAAVTAAKEAIVSGDIVVHDYRTDDSCPS